MSLEPPEHAIPAARGVERMAVHGRCGVPPTAKAIAVNVTTTGSTGVGSLKL